MTITDTTADRDLLADAWLLIYRAPTISIPAVLEPMTRRFERLLESVQCLEEENSALQARIVEKDNDIDELRAVIKEKNVRIRTLESERQGA